MKRTQRIEAFRNIRRNRISFLSVVIIAMLAVTAYLGLSFSAEGMLKSADATYEAEYAADIEINSASFITEEDIVNVLAAEGVADAEGIVSMPSRVSNGSETMDITVRSISGRMNLPHLREGRMPEADDECAVELTLARKLGYETGDQLRLSDRSFMTDACIKGKTYTVTGIFTAADHLTEMVSFEPMILVMRGAFNAGLIPEDRFSALLVRIEPDDPYRFSEAWKDSADRVGQRLESFNDGWIVTALHNTAGYVCTDENARMLNTVSITFSMLFVLIAALVIYSTIGRLVGQESHLVGAAKAMGLRNSEAFAKYMFFGVGGALAGTIAGVLIAYFVFERIVLFFFGTVFLFGEWVMAFRPVPVVIVMSGAAVLGFAAVFLACRRLMKSTAVNLMNGTNVSRHGRNRASSEGRALYVKLILRNMRMDWKRVLVSIISIAGSCMLLMIGFSLKYAISRVPEKQYDEIQHYSMDISLDVSGNPNALDSIRSILDGEDLPYTPVYSADTLYRAGGERGFLTLTCTAADEPLDEYYSFTDASSGDALDIPESGLLVSRMFAVKYQLETGDSVLLYDSRMNSHEAEIAGIFENYIGINAFCSIAYAEECFGEAMPCSTVLLLRSPQDPEALREKLSSVQGFISLTSSRKQESLFNGMSTMLNLIILLLGVLSVMIAYFILLNLVTTYVNQKKNELTIMRINGYTTAETIRYASLECYGITVLGILLGLAAGQGFSLFLLGLIAQISLCFVTTPVWISFAASALITALISGAIHYMAFRKIRTLKLSDIQK